MRLSALQGTRLDPHYFAPQFAHLAAAIRSKPCDTLGNLVDFSREQWNPTEAQADTFRYIEISNVNITTGEARAEPTPVSEAPSRARMLVRDGNLIISTTRPHHGAIALIDIDLDGCIASTGFAVVRGVKDKRIDLSYLWCVLRSRLCLPQMLQRSSGGNYPAITEDELRNVLIPVPDADTQSAIVAELGRRRDAARAMRDEAADVWQGAKAEFAARLLGQRNPLPTLPLIKGEG